MNVIYSCQYMHVVFFPTFLYTLIPTQASVLVCTYVHAHIHVVYMSPPPTHTRVRVIVEGESVSDWSGKVTELKRSFIELEKTLRRDRGEGKIL